MPYPDTIMVGGEPEAPAEGGGGDPMEDFRQGLELIRSALASDGLSENERLIIEKLTTMGQQFFAGREKEEQAALGGGPATNHIRRMVGSGR